MPLATPLSADFTKGTAGQAVATPSGCTLTGAAPTYVSDGAGGTLARFDSSGAAQYFRPTYTADSDYGQLVVDFRIPSNPAGTPTSNKEMFLLAGSGAILSSAVITTGRLLYSRDASASGAGGGGWASPTLPFDTMLRFQIASQKGSSSSTGTIKSQIIRKSDGAVLATQLYDGNANAGTVQPNGAIVGLRTATGGAVLDVAMFRAANQALDYLGDIPAGGGSTTFIPGADSELWRGDSTTDRSGSGAAQVKAAIVGNGQGYDGQHVLVVGVTGSTIAYENGPQTAVAWIDEVRNAGNDSRSWTFAMGGNGGASDLAQQKSWLAQLLAKVAAGPRTDYRVRLIGFARQDPANVDAARFWQAITETVAPSGVTLTKIDYNSAIHNGRDETGLWQSTSPTEAHMTSAGYQLRDQILAPQVTKASSTPTPTPTKQVAEGAPATYVATAVTRTSQQAEGQPVVYAATQPTRAPQAAEGVPVVYVATAPTRAPQVAEGGPSLYVATQPTQQTSVVIGWGVPIRARTPPPTGGGATSDRYADAYRDRY